MKKLDRDFIRVTKIMLCARVLLRQCVSHQRRWYHHDQHHQIVNNLVPIVIESTPKGERAWDIFSRLLRERIVYVNGPIHQNSADVIVAQLLFLESEDPDKPV